MKISYITEAGAMRRRRQPRIRFISWSSTGDIRVEIDGRLYEYNVSAHYHPRLQQMARYRPFAALNEIKMIHDAEARPT